MSELIHLISCPRNISTALMYSFGNRPDTAIVDEPFYGYYLKNYEIDFHPGTQEIIESMLTDADAIIEEVLFAERPEPYVFVKNMAHHMKGFDLSYTYSCKNIFLIRNPRQLIASFSKVINHPTMDDIGLKREKDLYEEIKLNGHYDPIVLDTGEVLKDPQKVLKELCDRLEIPFTEKMLSWDPGPRMEDGVWAPHWYKNVHQSTGFRPPEERREIVLSEELESLYKQVKNYYEALLEKSIKA